MIHYMLMSDQRIAKELHGKRYPKIESVRIVQFMDTPSACIKVRRRACRIGGPSVVRVYFVYTRRWLERWQAVQRKLFKEQ